MKALINDARENFITPVWAHPSKMFERYFMVVSIIKLTSALVEQYFCRIALHIIDQLPRSDI